MDPIHPITPVVQHLLPVLPSPKVGAVEREAPQGKPDQRRRKRPGTSGGVSDSERVAGAGGYYLERVAEAGEDDGLGPAGEDDGLGPAGEDDGLGHVDLTA